MHLLTSALSVLLLGSLSFGSSAIAAAIPPPVAHADLAMPSPDMTTTNLGMAPPDKGPYTGALTFFTPAIGACGLSNTAADAIVAISHILFDKAATGPNPNKNPLCGKKIRVWKDGGDKHAIDLTVVDRCVGCAATDLDTTPSAFGTLAALGEGRTRVQWRWLDGGDNFLLGPNHGSSLWLADGDDVSLGPTPGSGLPPVPGSEKGDNCQLPKCPVFGGAGYTSSCRETGFMWKSCEDIRAGKYDDWIGGEGNRDKWMKPVRGSPWY